MKNKSHPETVETVVNTLITPTLPKGWTITFKHTDNQPEAYIKMDAIAAVVRYQVKHAILGVGVSTIVVEG